MRLETMGERGFEWSLVHPERRSWSVSDLRRSLQHELARQAFERDFVALAECDACVLLLPSGRSAHLEAGWCAGKGKPVAIYAPELEQAELMYKLFDDGTGTPLFETLDEVARWANTVERRDAAALAAR